MLSQIGVDDLSRVVPRDKVVSSGDEGFVGLGLVGLGCETGGTGFVMVGGEG
jgi:hypothetical protein